VEREDNERSFRFRRQLSVGLSVRDGSRPAVPRESLALHFGRGRALMQRKTPSVPEFAVLEQLAFPAVRFPLKPELAIEPSTSLDERPVVLAGLRLCRVAREVGFGLYQSSSPMPLNRSAVRDSIE